MVMFLDFAWIKVNSGLDNNYIKVNLAYVLIFEIDAHFFFKLATTVAITMTMWICHLM